VIRRKRGAPGTSPPTFIADEVFLQPWFLDKKCAAAVRRLIPRICSHKMRFYFEDWGCLVCRSKKRRYGSNGMCHLCTTRIQKRLRLCLQRRAVKESDQGSPARAAQQEPDRVQIAKDLLSDIARREWSPNRLTLQTSVPRVKSVNSPSARQQVGFG
jgi:hypothetical protein